MAPTRSTKFNARWLDPQLFPDFAEWLIDVKDDIYSARCDKCKKTFSLSNMGVGAIKYHARGTEHKNILKQSKTQSLMNSYFNNTANSTKGDLETSAASTSTALAVNLENSESPIQSFFTKDEVLQSEILWALNVVEKRMSLNSCINVSALFKKMFPDSATAQHFQLGKDKASYFIHFGIAHYFQDALFDVIKNCSDITVCFDESLNKVAQKGQMDLHVKFWANEKVNSRYFGSVFLGKATAQDLLDSFLKALKSLPLEKILHVSMDGPNVNLAFLRKLEDHMSEENPNGKKLLKMGTCGLHVIHGAVKTGLKTVQWDMFGFLRNLYYLFKDSPARRAEFINITGCNKFAKKFCAVRWLENSDCIERAIEIADLVLKYLNTVKQTDSKVSVFLKNALMDPLLKCKLAFFKTISVHCESFLRKFQSDAVLVPYLHSELSLLLSGLIKKIVKEDKITEGSSLLKLDIKSSDNLLDLKKIDVGFGAKKILKELKIKDAQKNSFYADCQKVIQSIVQKIMDKSPLKYKIVRGLSCFHPSIVLHNSSVGSTRLNIVLEALYDANRISETDADKAKTQYSSFCCAAKEQFKSDFVSLLSGEIDISLDYFYRNILSKEKKWEDLWGVMKLCFIISHGNASVEKGFSINKTILVENLQEESLVNQRVVFDSIKCAGGTLNVDINKKMMAAVRAARQRYRSNLEQKKVSAVENVSKAVEKRKIEKELDELQSIQKKIRLEREKQDLELEKKMIILEEQKKCLL